MPGWSNPDILGPVYSDRPPPSAREPGPNASAPPVRLTIYEVLRCLIRATPSAWGSSQEAYEAEQLVNHAEELGLWGAMGDNVKSPEIWRSR